MFYKGHVIYFIIFVSFLFFFLFSKADHTRSTCLPGGGVICKTELKDYKLKNRTRI